MRSGGNQFRIGDRDEIGRDVGRGELRDELRSNAGGFAGSDGEPRQQGNQSAPAAGAVPLVLEPGRRSST
jgi:hypothetical protein